MLNGVSVARRNRVKPPRLATSASRFSPACAPSASRRRSGLLAHCRRDADARREGIKDAPDRIEVLGEAVAGVRLDQHQRAVLLQRGADVLERADRIAHVVQRVEQGREIVTGAGVILRPRGLKAHVRQVPGVLACVRDRGAVEVDAGELRVRERLRHDHGRCAVAAADVHDLGAALKLFGHAVERRQPVGDQVGLVAGAEEALDAAEQAVVVVAPAQLLAGLERRGELRLVVEHRGERVIAAGHADRAILVGEHRGLLRGQREGALCGVVGHETGRRLGGQPLAHVALARAGLLREAGRGELLARQRAVEAELVAGEHQRRIRRRADLVHHHAEQGLELGHVQRHGKSLSILCGACGARLPRR